MLSSSLYTMLKLSKTSSRQKLFDYDRVTRTFIEGGTSVGAATGSPKEITFVNTNGTVDKMFKI